MKNIIWIIFLLVSSLWGDNLITHIGYKHVQNGHLFDANASLSFKPIDLNRDKKTGAYLEIPPNESYWIGYSFLEPSSEGMLYIAIDDLEVDHHPLSPKLKYTQFRNNGIQYISFMYKKGDPLIHTMHIKQKPYTQYLYGMGVIEAQNYQDIMQREKFRFVFAIFIVGFLSMAIIYSLTLWASLRQSLYGVYALMQFGFVSYLVFSPTIALALFDQRVDPQLFLVSGGITTLVSTIFVRIFLQTKTYTPKIDKLLLFFLYFNIGTIIFSLFGYPEGLHYISHYVVVYLIVAVIRFKQGFMPAKFFILGWGVITITIIAAEFFNVYHIWFIPLGFISIPFEAIMMLMAISYLLKELKEAEESAKKSLSYQSKFAVIGEAMGQIAHQWRTPLNTMSYLFLYIEKKSDDHKIKEKSLKGVEYIQHLSQTIDSFLDFYRVNNTQENLNIRQEVEYIIDFLSHETEKYGIHIQIEEKSKLQKKLYKNALRHIIINLLQNAIEAHLKHPAKSKKSIIIQIDETSISIIDNAGGVSLDMRGRLFESYVTDKQKGSGIGLAMSRQMAEEQLGASLEFTPTLDGSCFTLKWNK
jgi:signal transduction histidine kinase